MNYQSTRKQLLIARLAVIFGWVILGIAILTILFGCATRDWEKCYRKTDYLLFKCDSLQVEMVKAWRMDRDSLISKIDSLESVCQQ